MYTTKKDLRNYWLKNRLLLSEPEKNNLSFKIHDNVLNSIPFQKFGLISIFLPVNEKCEVRTWSIIQYLQENYPDTGITAPRIKSPKQKIMESVLLEKHTRYIKNEWGIEEPEFGQIIKPEKIELFIIPLITFDLSGHRLGYGGGYYDRYLKNCAQALKIGLSFFEPVDKIPEINPFDIPLNMCITPSQIYNFN